MKRYIGLLLEAVILLLMIGCVFMLLDMSLGLDLSQTATVNTRHAIVSVVLAVIVGFAVFVKRNFVQHYAKRRVMK